MSIWILNKKKRNKKTNRNNKQTNRCNKPGCSCLKTNSFTPVSTSNLCFEENFEIDIGYLSDPIFHIFISLQCIVDHGPWSNHQMWVQYILWYQWTHALILEFRRNHILWDRDMELARRFGTHLIIALLHCFTPLCPWVPLSTNYSWVLSTLEG